MHYYLDYLIIKIEGREGGRVEAESQQCTIDVTTDYPDLSFLSTIQQEIVLH